MGSSSPAQQAENEAKASSSITIDESEPVTNIQIRLADGGRLVQKFNHSHRYTDNGKPRLLTGEGLNDATNCAQLQQMLKSWLTC